MLIAPLVVAVLAMACGGGAESATGSPSDSGGVSTDALAALLADGDAGSGISVSGLGTAVAVPNIGILSLGVSTQAATARGARDDAAARMTDLIESLEANGVDEKDYHTSQFSIDPAGCAA
jgi:uncharacterized protein YggE